MLKPSAVLFDYGNTLARSKICDIAKGIERILEVTYNPDNIGIDTIFAKAEELEKETLVVNQTCSMELYLVNTYRYIFEYYGMKFNIDDKQIERLFREAIFQYRPTEGIIEILNYLQKNIIKIGVLSNMEFSSETLSREIAQKFPNIKFEFIIASADYNFRKPSPRIFALAKRKLGNNVENIWYAGDKIIDDVKGATQADMTPVWYNPDNIRCDCDLNCIQINNWLQLIDIIKKGG